MIMPAMLPKTKEELEQKLAHVAPFTRWAHLDFADGRFVENTSLLWNNIGFLPQELLYEFHLMIFEPEHTIDHYLALKPKRVWLHVESSQKLSAIFEKAQAQGVEVGVAVNPETQVEQAVGFLRIVSSILLMAVHPGKTGQPFSPEALTKVRVLRAQFPKALIGVDGGINPQTIKASAEAGANHFVSSSYIFNSTSIPTALSDLESALGGRYSKG